MADLQEMLSRLKSHAGDTANNSQAGADTISHPQSYRQPSVSSPIFSPPPSGPQPHHQSAIMSPNTSALNTPVPDATSSDRTTSLLNLLRFNTGPASASGAGDGRPPQPAPLPQATPVATPSPISASDLVAQLTRKPPSSASQSASMLPSGTVKPPPRPELTSSSSENAQDFLLKLLNDKTVREEPAPVQQSSNEDPAARESEREGTPVRVFGTSETEQPTPFEPPQPVPKKGTIFTYVNPFEQLSASSPRNRSPKPESRQESRPSSRAPRIEILKPNRNTSPLSQGLHHRRSEPHSRMLTFVETSKLKAQSLAGSENVTTASTAEGKPDRQPREPPAPAVGDGGDQAGKQAEEALSAGQEDEDTLSDVGASAGGSASAKDESAPAKSGSSSSAEIKLEDVEQDTAEMANIPTEQPHDPGQRNVKDAGLDNVADSWESADEEDSPAKEEEQPAVRVYNFPMKPFVTIDIKTLMEPPASVRQDVVMEIARLKKEFDQIDRTLVTASPSYIAYALSKTGGFRLIRQDSGRFKHAFQSTPERIFNLSICSDAAASPRSHSEAVIATGVNGSVFWTMLPTSGSDRFEDENIDENGFIFPPIAHEDNHSGGQLKTRAKRSSRHPEFFGIGRGKSIYLIRAKVAREHYTDKKTRIVDTERYLKDWPLRISTGKAGKDFAFSEDDTVIVSLDKAGKMKFWDIRELAHPNAQVPGNVNPIEAKTPLLTLSTTSTNEKIWPTSVTFLDKERPSVKGIALRYLIVGMKQNHSIQLWDLGLGKPVQEINFPHANESDAICSIAYHARTGILAVGHPTRNSIYLIHLSAPKYTLQPMNQARYMQRLAQKDSSMLKPDSTAIMSGVREFSLGTKGQLRSLDLLSSPIGAIGIPDGFDDAMAFEVYVMHSKGVTCLRMKREDLGWTKDGKIQHPVDAEATGAIVVRTLRDISSPTSSEPSLNGDSATPKLAPSKASGKDVGKKESLPVRLHQPSTPESNLIASTLARVENKQDAARAAIMNGSDKADKKRKKRNGAGEPQSLAAPSYAQAAQRGQVMSPGQASTPNVAASQSQLEEPKSSIEAEHKSQASAAFSGISDKDVRRIEESVAAELSTIFQRELTNLYRKIDDDRRVQDAAGAAKQDAVLRLVSSTLTDNVEKSLSRIVSDSMQTAVLPALTEVSSATIERKLKEVLTSTVPSSIQHALKPALQGAVSRALQEPDVVASLSNVVSVKVAASLDAIVSKAVRTSINPALSDLPARVALQVSSDVERNFTEKLRQADAQRANDSLKIDQLTTLVRGLSEMVHTMAAAQSEFQSEILKLQRQVVQSRDESTRSEAEASVRTASTATTKSPEEKEMEAVMELVKDGNYTEGTIKVRILTVQTIVSSS